MKKQNKQAVAAAAVKAASNEATEVETLNNEVAAKKATQPQRSKTKKAPSKQKSRLTEEEVYADILANIKDDTIELWYACIGYTLDSNKPIYSYEMLIDLLINYGYTISYILYALDKLAVEDFYDDGSGLLIMNCAQRNMIYSDIEPLDNDVVKQLQKQFVPGRC